MLQRTPLPVVLSPASGTSPRPLHQFPRRCFICYEHVAFDEFHAAEDGFDLVVAASSDDAFWNRVQGFDGHRHDTGVDGMIDHFAIGIKKVEQKIADCSFIQGLTGPG